MDNDRRRALGRGLETLLPAARAATAAGPAAAAGDDLREILVEDIDRNQYQTRGRIKEESLNELAASIRTSGVMQPVLVRPGRDGRYELIAGERRWLASQRAGKKTIPAVVKPVSDQQALEMTIIENLQREDLGPMDQARAFERLSREFNLTQEQIAQRTGKDRTTISNYIRLLKLPVEVQMELEHNFKITLSHAKLLMSLNTTEEIKAVASKIVRQELSVGQTETLIFEMRNPITQPASPAKPVDPNVREAQRHLEQALGLKVRIKDRSGRGTILLEYHTLDDFDRVVEMLTAKK
jgi:ParB family transcriptional regulator, chromosome partitioning protein